MCLTLIFLNIKLEMGFKKALVRGVISSFPFKKHQSAQLVEGVLWWEQSPLSAPWLPANKATSGAWQGSWPEGQRVASGLCGPKPWELRLQTWDLLLLSVTLLGLGRRAPLSDLYQF